MDHPNRPFPPPQRRWALFMRWHDLLFMHWRIAPDRLRPFIPPGLELQTFDGDAWLGVVPFRMSGIRHRLLPPIPGLSAFPELNVRTYVHPRNDPARPGVWFFSLDTPSRIAVRAARSAFNLPYMDAAMTCTPDGDAVRYSSRRTGPYADLVYGPTHTRRAEFSGRYRPTGPASVAAPGSLESFLTDRYCLYTLRNNRLLRLDIHHDPWPLQPAAAGIARNTAAEPLGIPASDLAAPPLLHFSRRLDVVAWIPVATQESNPG